MDKNELERKKALKKKALDDAMLKIVNGGIAASGPVNFICTFDPNPNLDPIEPKPKFP